MYGTDTQLLNDVPATIGFDGQVGAQQVLGSLPAVAGDPSRVPMRRLAISRAGSKIAVPAVSTRPMMLVSARSPAARARIASAAI